MPYLTDEQRKEHLDRFKKDTEHHKMVVIRDDAPHRFVQFLGTQGSAYWFNIITWPGTLCISGDCGTFVFRRTHDMTDFFREGLKYKGTMGIDYRYWAEKVVAEDKDGGVKGFSSDRFRESVKDYFDQWFTDELSKSACPAKTSGIWIRKTLTI